MNDKLQRLRDYLFGTTKQVTEQLPYANVTKSVPDQPNIVQRAIGSISNLLSKVGSDTVNISPQQQYQPKASPSTSVAYKQPVPTVQPVYPTPSPAPVAQQYQPQEFSPQAAPSLDVDTIKRMVEIYGGQKSKLSLFAKQLADATALRFFKDNPELLALIPHLETNSGKYITRPNNLTNWGINYPGNNDEFAKMSEEEVLNKFIYGLGKNSPYYEKFRTGKPLTDQELLDFANVYEPANPAYGPNLINGRKHIRKSLGWGDLGGE